MRLVCPVAVALWGVAFCSLSGFADTEVPSRVADVTVFSDRATAGRVGEVDVAAGETTLTLGGLPEEMVEDSVQVQADGAPGLALLGTDLRREILAGAANPEARKLEDQVRALERQKAELSFQAAQLKQREAYLVTLTTAFARGEKATVSVTDLESIYRFYVEETTRLGVTQRDLQRQMETAGLELDRLKAELERLNRSKGQRTLLVRLRATGPAHVRLRVQYQVKNASWRPAYNARAAGDENRVLLDYGGIVRQRTGEDWPGVMLALSTAQPGLSGRMPDFEPVYLNFPEPRPAAESNARIAPKAMASAGAAAPAAPPPVDQVPAEVIRGGQSVSYRAPLPVTVPSDGEGHEVPIQQFTLESKPVYVTNPARDAAAFLRYHVTNRSDALLLAGNVNLYRDGDLIGKGELADVPPGAEFDLDFGRDQNLTVQRKVTVDRRSSSGLINRKDARERKIQVTVENHHPVPVRVRVFDGLPVPQNAEITVSGVSFSEPPTVQDQETGKLMWEFEVPSQGKKTIEFGYTVQWPQGKEIEETH